MGDVETGAALVKFQKDKMGIFVVGRNSAHGYHIETEITGTEGVLRVGVATESNNVVLFNEQGAVQECIGGFLERFEKAYLNMTEEFIRCIQENRKPAIGIEDGVRSTALGLACKKSFKTNQLIHVS